MSIPADVVFRTLGDESVLLHLGSGEYFGLDEVGTRIWKMVTEGLEVAQIEERILEAYDATPEQVRLDVRRILEELRSRRLVEFKDAGSGTT